MFARNGTVVSLYDRTGRALMPWAQAGYRCVAVDLTVASARAQHPRIKYLTGDVRSFDMPRFTRFAMAWPPCTHLTNTGARWWAAKGRAALDEALSLVAAALALFHEGGSPWLLENPPGRLSRYWRAPDLYVEPWHFAGWSDDPAADSYTKKTGLWLGGGARPPVPNPVPGLPINTKYIHHAPSCSPRRSVTPQGLARAIYEGNK